VNPAERRRLGHTDLELTVLGLGGAPLGDLFERLTDRQADAVLEAAWTEGIRFFDTAPYYGHGQSEHRVGRFLRTKARDEYVLSTKVGRVLRRGRYEPGAWAGGLPFEAVFDYGRDGVLRSFEDSLQRLGLTRLDLLVIHDLDLWHHDAEQVENHLDALAQGGIGALQELRHAEDVRAIGAGVNEVGMVPRLLERVELDFVLLAMPYTLLHQDALDEELPLCAERAIAVVIGAPFQSGILAGAGTYNYGPASSEVVARVQRIRAACDRYGVPVVAAALQFPLGHPLVASVIPGAVRPEQVRQNAAALRRPIPEGLWTELKSTGLLHADAPLPNGDASGVLGA
jgi:D-threo-aldose 1-dehydrogenase